jgi:N-acetyl-anhydromuramyl-L-alanine amidase AmpD
MIQYPKAEWKPLKGHSNPGTLQQRTQIVLHITDGTVEPFGDFQASPDGIGGKSAHFGIDRDGKVYQYVDVADTSWHADPVNSSTVGIEHVALTKFTADQLNAKYHTSLVEMPATPQQYAASAELLCWLCKLLNIPPDRRHIREHCEVSPHSGHSLCCHGALDPDKVVNAARDIFFHSTSAGQRVLFAMGPGTPWLRLSEIKDRVKLYPGDFFASTEGILRELEKAGAVQILEERGQIRQAYKTRP